MESYLIKWIQDTTSSFIAVQIVDDVRASCSLFVVKVEVILLGEALGMVSKNIKCYVNSSFHSICIFLSLIG